MTNLPMTSSGRVLQAGKNSKPVLLCSDDFSEGTARLNVNGQPPTIRYGRAYFDLEANHVDKEKG